MPTTPELKHAYQRTGLSFLGMSFDKAMDIPAIRISLHGLAKAEQKKAHHGKPAPIQPALI